MWNQNASKWSILQVLGLFNLVVGILLPAMSAAATIFTHQNAKVVILSGYSANFEKQQLSPFHVALDSTLESLQSEFNTKFDARAEYFSESRLAQRMKLEGLPTGSPEIVKEFLAKQGYEFVITADVVQSGDKGVGYVTMNFLKLWSDGTVAGKETMPELRLTASQRDIDRLRLAIVDYVVGNHQDDKPDVRKTVHISCVAPKFLATKGVTEQLSLASHLSKAITEKLIEFYHSKPMMDRGYISIINSDAYKWEPSDKGTTCVPVVRPLLDAEYHVNGNVSIVRPERGNDFGFDHLDVKFDVTFEDCVPRWSIGDEFPRDVYRRQEEYSAKFSEQKLRDEYEREWTTKVEGRVCH